MKLEEKINREIKSILESKKLIVNFEDVIACRMSVDENLAKGLLNSLKGSDFIKSLKISRCDETVTSMLIEISPINEDRNEQIVYCYYDFIKEICRWIKPNSLEEFIDLLKEKVTIKIFAKEQLQKELLSFLKSTDIEFSYDYNSQEIVIVPRNEASDIRQDLSVAMSEQNIKAILPKKEKKSDKGVERMTSEVKYHCKDEEYDFIVLAAENRYVYLSKDRNKLLIVDKQGKVIEFVDLNSKDK